MTLLENLPHRCDGYVRARTDDGYGGNVDTFTKAFSDRSCWRQAASEAEINEFSKRGIRVSAKVYFNSELSSFSSALRSPYSPTAAISEVHQLEFDGVRFDVVSVAEPDSSAGMGVLWRVMVEAKTTDGTEL